MPGKRWTKQEKGSLRKQIAAGVPPHNILIENRGWAGICYMLRVLRIRWSNRWTPVANKELNRADQARKQTARIADCE